jgi:predicted DNA-binding protein (UPF0251 family)
MVTQALEEVEAIRLKDVEDLASGMIAQRMVCPRQHSKILNRCGKLAMPY